MAVVGTGASAVQFVPEIAPRVGSLSVFQRTGNWFLPRENRRYPRWLRAAIERVPGLQAYRRCVRLRLHRVADALRSVTRARSGA